MLAQDLVYRARVRLTHNRAQGLGFSPTMAHFDDTFGSLARREQGWRIARRNIYLVQSTLDVPNLGFFL